MSNIDLQHSHIAYDTISAAFPNARITPDMRIADLPFGEDSVWHLHSQLGDVFSFGMPDVAELAKLDTVNDVVFAVVQSVAAERRVRTAKHMAEPEGVGTRFARFVRHLAARLMPPKPVVLATEAEIAPREPSPASEETLQRGIENIITFGVYVVAAETASWLNHHGWTDPESRRNLKNVLFNMRHDLEDMPQIENPSLTYSVQAGYHRYGGSVEELEPDCYVFKDQSVLYFVNGLWKSRMFAEA